jgi:hypothetical protein
VSTILIVEDERQITLPIDANPIHGEVRRDRGVN